MAFAPAETLSRPRVPALALVILIHALLAWAFISGLAYRVVERASEQLKTFDVVEPAPPAEEPPAPAETAAEPTEVNATPSPIPSPKAIAASAPALPSTSAGAGAVGARLRSGAFHNETDYPSRAKSRGEEGTVRVSYTITAEGRVTGCTVTASSGSPSLDSTTCRILERRFRYAPARDSAGNAVAQTKSQSVTWDLQGEA